MNTANLMEIFTSYQGEGLYAGVRQLFIRFAICHMRCIYCDTPESWTAARYYRVERRPHSGEFDAFENPATTERLLEHVDRALAHGLEYHSAGITGGEPLAHAAFLERFLPKLRERLPVYLETSGTLSNALGRIASWVDYFALDIKPPSTPGVRADWDDIQRCLSIARGRGFVKIVVMADTPTEDEVRRAHAIMPPEMPLVLMPVTPVNAASVPPGGERLQQLRRLCEKRNVYVIPQIHRLAGWL